MVAHSRELPLKRKQYFDLSKLNKLGVVPMRLEGVIYTATYSQKSCLWFEWIHSSELIPGRGYTAGSGTGCESPITVMCTAGDLTVYPERIMLYIAPSFDDKANVDGKERFVMEFCLESNRTYYGFSERFTYHLPPFRFLPFIPRRKTTWLLALTDKPLEKGRPVEPLIPTRQGMTG